MQLARILHAGQRGTEVGNRVEIGPLRRPTPFRAKSMDPSVSCFEVPAVRAAPRAPATRPAAPTGASAATGCARLTTPSSTSGDELQAAALAG